MIMDTNVFIADTVERVDSTVHIQGFINNMKPEKLYLMTLPDGTKTATEIMSDLRETFCDNQGNRLTKFIFSNVRYSLKNRFNLFIFAKRLINGCDLGG